MRSLRHGQGRALADALCRLLVLVGCASAGTTVPIGRATPPSTSTRSVPTPLATPPIGSRPSPGAGLLDPAPTDCATVEPPHALTEANFGGGFVGTPTFHGSTPAWELGLGSGPLHLNEYSSGPVPYPSTKVMWVVGPNYDQPVTLTGHEVRSGVALWFQIYPSNDIPTDNPDALTTYTTHAMLAPAAPNRGTADNSRGHWNIWGIGITVLSAGCYEVDVTSAAGNWRCRPLRRRTGGDIPQMSPCEVSTRPLRQRAAQHSER